MRARKEGTLQVESVSLGELSTNCYLVTTEGLVVLIDPAEASGELFSLLKGRKVDLVLNTHGHFDHVGGDWALKEEGARVAIHKADLAILDHFYPGHPPVDRYLEEGDEVVPGLVVLHVPGHSPGSVVFVGDGILFSGDLLFSGSIGRTDLPGGSDRAMEESLRRILEFPGGYTVYPGHGPRTTLAREKRTNPFLLELRPG